MDQYGVYLPLVYDTVWIHQRRSEQEKKQGIGWEGRITDNILFNYCLNKNIVFLKKKKPIKVKQDKREKRNEEQTSYLQEQTRKRKPTEERKTKQNKT